MIEKMKVVHIVTTAPEKKALLDKLQKMGIVHFSEKAGADQPLLQRFSDLSRMALVLHEYPDAAAESAVLPDDEFEKFFGRPADKKRKLYNGMLKCYLYQYFK